MAVLLTIQNYATGGEPVSASEVSAQSVRGVVMGTVPPTANSLAVPLLPILDGGKIKLFQFSGGSFVEIPPTTALNAQVSAVILVP